MSRVDDFARQLMERNAGGTPVPEPLRGTGEGVNAGSTQTPATAVDERAGEGSRTLGVDVLQRGQYQPREDMRPETLSDLAESIRAQGIVQPIVVRPIADGRFEIVAGERRWRAAQIAGLSEVPVVVRQLDDQAAITIALIENIQRETLNPLEEAKALRMLADNHARTSGTVASQQTLALMVGKSVSWISRRLAILERPEAVQQSVADGTLALAKAARQPERSATPPGPQKTTSAPQPVVRVDFGVLQASVKRLTKMADTLGLPGIDLPNKPARKDFIAAFEQRVTEILDAAHRSIKPE